MAEVEEFVAVRRPDGSQEASGLRPPCHGGPGYGRSDYRRRGGLDTVFVAAVGAVHDAPGTPGG